MDKIDLPFLTASQLSRLIETKEVSPVAATEAYLDRIQEVDSKLNSYITVTGEQALEAARQAEQEIAQGNHRGPLHGVPVAVKDLDWGARVFADLFQDPEAGLLVDGAAFAGVGAGVFAGQAEVAALGVIVPPGFDGPAGVVSALGPGPRTRGGDPQAFGQRDAVLTQRFDLTDDFEAQQREAFLGWRCLVVHTPDWIASRRPSFHDVVLWDGSGPAA